MKAIWLAGACGLAMLVSGCGAAEEESTAEALTTLDVAAGESASYSMAAPPPPPIAAPPAPEGAVASSNSAGRQSLPDLGAIPTAAPKVAYSYAYGFRLPAGAIRPLQERHADMCEAKGADLCRIVSMEQSEDEGDYASGTLTLAVAAPIARKFGKDLAAATGKAEGELVSSSIEGEDLSKRIVDTEARLRARTALRDRLMEVLQTRRGTVTELVEAERGVAQVNEEIDQANSWLTEMRGRVAFSTMAVTYQAGTPSAGGFTDPIRSAWGSVGTILGGIVSVLIVLATVLVPLGGLVWLAYLLTRRLTLARRRWRAADELAVEGG